MVVAKPGLKPIVDRRDAIALPVPRNLGEQRLSLTGISWDGYLKILDSLPETRSIRLTYDDGTLEFTMPLVKHESLNELIRIFIWTMVELMGLSLICIGSTTINYPGKKKGCEPDCAYYIQNVPLVKGREIDFSQDPPPDLVVEVDITHTDIRKNEFYADLGVPEFWRFDGMVLRVYQLQAGEYVECDRSPTFPQAPKERFYQFLAETQDDHIEAVRSLRRWWAEIETED
jgi:Uma2 family endonuclease